MARKDVDLVIRAKDEAAAVVDRITKALNEFTEAQSSLGTKAQKTESVFGQLGAAISGLDKAISGLDLSNQFGAQIDRAAAAVGRLEKSVADGRGEVQQLSTALSRAEAVAARYEAKLAGAANALTRQKEAVAKAKAEQSSLSVAYERTVKALDKLVAQQAAIPAKIAQQTEAVAKAEARYNGLSATLAATAAPSKSLVVSLEAAQRALGQQRARLTELQGRYADLGGRILNAQTAMDLFEANSSAATASLARQQAVLSKIETNYDGLGQKARAATQQQKTLDASLDKATGSLSRQSSTLAKAETEYAALTAAATKFRAALSGSVSAGRDELGSQLVDQGLAVQKSRKEFEQLSASVRRLEQDAKSVTAFRAVTKEMAQDIAFAAQRAEEAQMKFLLQQEALERLGRAYMGVTDDIQSVARVQSTFAAEQTRLAAAMKETSEEGFRQRQALRGITENAREAGAAAERLASANRGAASASQQNAQATSAAAEAYRRVFGDSRQALGVTQRLRGEVLSLIAAYGGLYGVINTLGQVSEAYQTLEAAQARLNVANNGGTAKTAEDLDFLRRTADRLGIEFGGLATEYSKFAIATQGTNLEGAATRKIFLSVAEAARVSRTSAAEMSGVFVALTQIVSKGAVQMEELRQQLGDRLPGALQIMADGLGVTTAELIKMMEAGEVTSDALLPFAEELDRRFGPGLGEALSGTSVALGRLKNAAFQALLTFGEAGFMESFARLLNDVTDTIQSADFQTFTSSLSSGFATLADALGFVVRNFQLFVVAISAFTALRVAPLIAGLATDFGALSGSSAAAAAGVTAVGRASAGAAASTGLLARALSLIRANPIGLLLSVAAGAMAYWATEADSATEALDRHISILDKVKTAYEGVNGSVSAWRNNLDGLTVTEAKSNLDDLVAAAEEARNDLLTAFVSDGETGAAKFFGLGLFTGASQEYNAEIDKVIQKWRSAQLDAKGLIAEIDRVNQQFDDGSDANARYGAELIAAAKRILEVEDAIAEAEKIVDAMTGTVEEAGAALDELAGKSEDAGSAVNDNFNSAMKELQGTVDKLIEAAPEAKGAVDEIAAGANELQKHYNEALSAARQLPDAIMRAAAEQAALNGLAEGFAALQRQASAEVDAAFGNFTDGVEAAAAVLREFEGFSATPYYDVNAFRAGFGSDTITLADGTIQKVVEGISVSVEDANRDLIRRITTEFMPIAEAAAGSSRFATFTPQQQAALTSIAYNYGEIPARIAEAVRTGTTQEIADAIRGLAGDNNGINEGRRFREAALFESSASVEALSAEQVRQDEERRRKAEEEAKRAADAADRTKERLADGEFEIAQQERLAAGKEREAAIQDAIRQAKEENAAITDEELAKIAEQAGKVFDLEQQQKNALTTKERAQKAEEEVNNLLAQRAELVKQIELAGKEGDFATQERLRGEIDAINSKLVEAIENSKAMWAAVGGSEADAAIAKLGTATIEAQNFSVTAKQNYLDWSKVADLFVTGLASAFDRFAQAVAEGKNVGEAARDAFLQFAADFLLQIARMIIQQAIFNALQGAFGGTKFGALIGLGHTGGVVGSQRVGSGNSSRKINPAIFAGAVRYHTGGIVGLAPNEVPIIAKKGEAMLTEDDPFHPANRAKNGIGSGGGSATVKQRIVNAIDAPSFLDAALSASDGEKVLLNWIRANADAVQSAMS